MSDRGEVSAHVYYREQEHVPYVTCRSAAVGGRGNLKSSSETGFVKSLTMSEVASAAFAQRLMALIGIDTRGMGRGIDTRARETMG